MTVHAAQIVRWVEQLAPKRLAIGNDPVGWQIGSPDHPVDKALVTLEVTPEVLDHAEANGIQLIIAHHPLFFRAVQSIRFDDPKGKMIERCIRNGIAVYAAHTNLDVAPGGLNDWLAQALGLTNVRPFSRTAFEPFLKLVVYSPDEAVASVSQAMFDAGAGWIGKYSHCSFRVHGTGTYLPEDGADPYAGSVGQLEQAEEQRIETVVPKTLIQDVLRAMNAAHPYEEVAYDVFEMHGVGVEQSIGRIGELPGEVSLGGYAAALKKALGLEGLRVVGSLDDPVRKVAVIGGSGRSYWQQAQQAGADVYVTGDVDYHSAVDALAAGMRIIDIGHHTESIMQAELAKWLSAQAAAAGAEVEFVADIRSHQPFRFL